MANSKKVIGIVGTCIAFACIIFGVAIGMSTCGGQNPQPSPSSSQISSSQVPLSSSIPSSSQISSSIPSSSQSSSKTPSSSSKPSSSSGKSSSSSSSSSKPSSSSIHEHQLSDWKYDEYVHYKECLVCHEHLYEDLHSLIETRSQNKDNILKTDVSNECSVCGYKESHIEDASEQEICDYMNNKISSLELSNVFDPKIKFLELGYPVLKDLSNGSQYGYSPEMNKMVIIGNNNSVIYPTECKNKSFIPYHEILVGNHAEMIAALKQIMKSNRTASGIKVNNNFTLYDSIGTVEVSGELPIDINFNGKAVSTNDYIGYMFRVTDEKSTLLIRNGTISTISPTLYQEVYPACLHIKKAKEVVVDNMTLISNADYGYGFLDSYDTNPDMKCTIKNCTFTAPACAVLIQNGNYLLKDNYIHGAVSINGGSSIIDHCTIISSAVELGETPEFVSNNYLYDICKSVYVDGTIVIEDRSTNDIRAITTADAITIFDRRSVFGTFSSPEVIVKNSTLSSYSVGNSTYGYGVRYMDLGFDTSKESNVSKIIIEDNNNFTECKETSPKDKEGGYVLYTNN